MHVYLLFLSVTCHKGIDLYIGHIFFSKPCMHIFRTQEIANLSFSIL